MKQYSTTSRTVRLFGHHANQYKRYLYPLLFSVPITVLIGDIIQPFIVSRILAIISSGVYDKANLWASFDQYLIPASILTIAWAVVGWRINVWLIWNLEINVVRDLNRRIFKHLLGMSANFHANRFGGSLVSQTNKLAGAYIRFADATVFNLLTLVVSVVAAITVLAPRVPMYAGIMLLLSTLFVAGTAYFSKAVRVANSQESAAQTKQTGQLADAITNIMAIKSFARSSYENERFAKTTDNVAEAGFVSLRKTTARETFASMTTSSIGIAALFIAVFGTRYFGADIATLFLIVSYTGSIGVRLWEFQNILRQYNRAFGDAIDMVEILAIEPEVKDPSDPVTPKNVRGQVTFENVVFTHDGSKKPLFDNLSLTIKEGEKVGLVGRSGSGKTTLTRLIQRYSDIDSGSIKFDDYNIRDMQQDDLRRLTAYVPQEPLLFHRSLAENIGYGKDNPSMEDITRVAKMAHAHEFIKDLPDGYQTLVGERGVKLSGGQRQRVAIARAMLKQAPILLLDEATSALDSESEVLIQDALWKLMEGRTALVIAHRLSTVQKMDRIIVMSDGKITEEGTHQELLKAKGAYAELWAHQSGGFLED